MAENEAKNPYQKIDAHLQKVLQEYESNQEIDMSQVFLSRESDKILVDVIARLEDPNIEVPGLEIRTHAGRIVTGQVDISSLRQVADHENIRYLSAASIVGKSANY
jgi:hypothetical protein